MIQLKLTPDEAKMLGEILRSYLSDLRSEIADTERKAFRESLKAQEALINKLLQELPQG